MMSKNSIVPFLKDYLIKFLTRPFLLDTNDMGNIDTDFFRELCLRNGELRYYKRNEFILREGEVGSFFGFIVSGVIKYTCINQTENKTYNVGFSFANEFISDYPNCLYDITSVH